MFHQRKAAPNGILQPSTTTKHAETSLSLQGAGHKRHRSGLHITECDRQGPAYSCSNRRQTHHQPTPLGQRHRGKQQTSESAIRKLPRSYDRQLQVPEPDYSQSDTDDRGSSIRIRNPNYWANSSEYYYRSGTNGHVRCNRSKRETVIDVENHVDPTESVLTSASQRKNTIVSSHRWSNDADLTRTKQYSLPTRKSRDISTDHVTTITLTDAAGDQANGGPFASSLRRDEPANDGNHRPNYRNNDGNMKTEILGVSSQRVQSVIPSAFSNVNLLKRVNDRYKLTERLLIQLKIIAVLHAFFGLSMFSLDSSQAIVLWPYVEEADQRLYLCLRSLYSLAVVLIGCLTIAISCGKRAVLLEIVKLLSIVFITLLLAAPAQTPFFQNLADSLQYNDALRRFRTAPPTGREQLYRQRHLAARADAQGESPIGQGLADASNDSPSSEASQWRVAGMTPKRSSLSRATRASQSDDEKSQTIDSKPSANSAEEQTTTGGSAAVNTKSDQRRYKALRIAQHLRIAYIIFGCCHLILTVGTLVIVIRLERIS